MLYRFQKCIVLLIPKKLERNYTTDYIPSQWKCANVMPRTFSFKYSADIRFPKAFSELSVETRNPLVLDSLKTFRPVLRDDLGS